MKNPSVKERRSKNASHPDHAATAKHLQKLREKQFQPRVVLAEDYRRSLKGILSKKHLSSASEIMNRVQADYHQANVRLGPELSRWNTHHKKAQQTLARTLPNYREWKSLAEVFRKKRQLLAKQDLVARARQGIHIDRGDVLPADPEVAAFTPPFSLYDSDHAQYVDLAEVQDNSLEIPSIGHLVTDVAFEHRKDDFIRTDLAGFGTMDFYDSYRTCGSTFTAPSRGKLRVRATFKNFYNHVVCSTKDCFGFSEAEIDVLLEFIIVIVQPNQVKGALFPLAREGLVSFGSDLSYLFPSLDTTCPYEVEYRSPDTLAPGTSVNIYAGVRIFIASVINDMETSARARLWWQLQKLSVGMV